MCRHAGPVETLPRRGASTKEGTAEGMASAGSGLQIGGLPTQTDVKNRWPDGSIRFAVITAKVPAGGGTYQINAGTLSAGAFIPSPQTAVVSLNIHGCLPSAGPSCPAGLHAAALPAPETATWLSGPLVHEARSVVRPLGPLAMPHPFLRVNFDTRVYNDGTSRIDVSVENMLNSADARTVTYDVAVTVPGATSFSKNNVEHAYLTRWRKLFSSATFATITPDLTPFNLARALPPYLSIVADQVDTHTGRLRDLRRVRSSATCRRTAVGGLAHADWTALCWFARTRCGASSSRQRQLARNWRPRAWD